MKTFLQKHLDDVLIINGATLIVATTAALNVYVALYMAGICMVVFGVLIGMGQGRKGK